MILRHFVCIPCFDNPKTVGQVVSQVLSETDLPILVVDDGSKIKVSDLLIYADHQRALESGRLKIHRFQENQGKGKALQYGIQYGLSKNMTHMISMDSDGQHFASEIAKLTDEALRRPWDLIIGNRKLEGDTVPGISKFGRKFSNYWVKYQTDRIVADSQSGFRNYPLFHCQDLKFWTKKFDFEIEILIRLIWKGVAVRDINVACVYHNEENRVSHFHKFFDNGRISALNAIFVILSLLKSHKSPTQIGLALGVGVLIGCTPFYGFHTLIVAALSFLLRLNFIYLFIGSNISLPFLAPFIMTASYLIGSNVFGIPTDNGVAEKFVILLTGSLILGSLLGLLVGILGAAASTFLQYRGHKKTWTGATRGGKLGNGFMKFLMTTLGLDFAQTFLVFVVPYFYIFAPQARKSSNLYWKRMHPQSGWFKRQWLVLKHFYTFSLVLTDRVYQNISHDRTRFESRSRGAEHILKALEAKKGLVMVGSHTGGWDLAAALLGKRGLGEVFMLQHQHQGLTLEKAVAQKDEGHVKRIFYNTEEFPILSVREIIRNGKPLGIMGDRPVSYHCELVPFLGGLAAFDTTPYRIASVTGASVLYTFGFKSTDQKYDFFAIQTRELSRDGNSILQCYDLTQRFAFNLETLLRSYPDQWFNFYSFWSKEPSRNEATTGPRNHLIEQLNKLEAETPAAEVGSRQNVGTKFQST